MPDLLSKDCRSTSSGFEGFKADNIGVTSRQTKTASEWKLLSRTSAVHRQRISDRCHPVSRVLPWRSNGVRISRKTFQIASRCQRYFQEGTSGRKIRVPDSDQYPLDTGNDQRKDARDTGCRANSGQRF